MVAFIIPIRCLLLFFILFQSVSLYKIYVSDDNQSDLSHSFVNEGVNQGINDGIGFDTNGDDNKESKSKRSIQSYSFQPVPQRRNNRPHWNPLIAAYKRCGDLVSREERESCFKEAVQMLFVHKL